MHCHHQYNLKFGQTVFPCLVFVFAFSTHVQAEVKKVIGPVATVQETESNLEFAARVDTGATTSSVHVDKVQIEDEAQRMVDNVGKPIRFRVNNHDGETKWLKRRIVDISEVKTSERSELRYKVPLTLKVNDVKKRVLVSLNNRSHMTYPVLLGRNFLRGEFIVDVELDADNDS